MKVIRKSVFETNSSSTHSIKINEGDKLTSSLLGKNGVHYVECEEFGWERTEYYDAETKLSYIITYLMKDIKDEEDVSNYLNSDEKRKEYFEKIKKAVKEHTGLDIKIIKNNRSWFPYGYVDHQSHCVPLDVISGTVDDIKNFIFNPNVELIIDNDNNYY